MKCRQFTEYEVTYEDHNVDHVSRKVAVVMVKLPPADVILIERVTRYGDDVEEFDERKKYETLFEREETE